MDGDDKQHLQCRDVSVGWPAHTVATGITFQVQPGSICVIAGCNGAGKSTLLKTVARQLKPLAGEVGLNGCNIWDTTSREFAQKVAYVPQSLEPAQDMTVLELALLGRNPHQRWWSWEVSQEDRQAVKDALEKTETWELRKQYLSNLSGGERQRAMVATALAQCAQFILLDEPTAHLDFRHQLELADLLVELKKQNLGLLLVLHDLNLIGRLADQVMLLAKRSSGPSEVVACGSPQSVLQPTNLLRAYEVEVDVVDDPIGGSKIFLPRREVRTISSQSG